MNEMKIKSKAAPENGGEVVLEDEMKKYQGKLDGFGHELKIILAEINIIAGWISEKFGVVLIDKASLPLKQCECNEIEEISARISSFKTANVIHKVAATTNKAKKSNHRSYDNEVFYTESNNESQFDSDDSLQETFEDGLDGSITTVSKNKRGRPKKHDVSKSNLKSKIEFKTNSKRGRPKQTKPTIEIIENINLTSTCEECGKVLKDSGSLRQHKLIHKNLKPYPCPDCGKCFRRNFHLKTHRLIHAGIKKHQCGYCGKLFLLPKDLVAHERTHTGERPFSCTTCPKSFNLKSHLVMHIRTHTGEKPYKCDVCDKTFSQSNSLRVHKKVHQRQQTTTTQIASSPQHIQIQPSPQSVIIDDSSPGINESHLHSDQEEMVSLLSRSNSVYSSMTVPISNLITFELMPMSPEQNEQSVSNSPVIEHQHQVNDQEGLSLGYKGTLVHQNKVADEKDEGMCRVELLNTISVKTKQINVQESQKNQEQHINESETTQIYDNVTFFY